MEPLVQISLDLTTIGEALEVARAAMRAGVDWLEAGTPLILAEGLHGVRALRAEFPNRELKWLPGRFLKVRIAAGGQDAFLVPQSAVTQTEQTRTVWVAGPDGKANPRPVQTANWLGND